MHIQVQGTGNLDAKIMLIGDHPYILDVRIGQPFTGDIGRALYECLTSAGLMRGDLYTTLLIKSTIKAPESYITHVKNFGHTWSPDGIEYRDQLKSEILAIRPHVVVPLGNMSLYALTSRWGITKWRGSVIESTLIPGMKVIPTLSPATLLANTDGGGQFHNQLLIIQDLIKVKAESEFPYIKLTERRLRIQPSFIEAMNYLQHCYEQGLLGTIIDYDIEVDMKTEECSCISFAFSPYDSMSIPFIDANGNYFDPIQEESIWRAIAKILESPKIAKRGQNSIFDASFLFRNMGIRPGGMLHDTMVAQKISMPDYKAGLDTIASIHTDIPYYKDDGKKWITGKGGTWINFWKYNAMDSIVTAAAFPSLLDDLAAQQNLLTYNRQVRIIPALIYMQEKGVLMDVEGIRNHRVIVEKEVAQLQEELNTLAGRTLNPNSPKQLKEYFYTIRGFKPYMKRGKKGKPSTVSVDDMALKRLARQGVREAEIIQDLRSLTTKTLGTYLDITKISRDGRYRPAYKPVGTQTGRLSSAENLFDEGGNMQNWPHDLMRFMKPDPGHLFLSFDLSQAENRIVAYVGGVLEMIDCFESGKDVHSLTGARVASVVTGQFFTPEEIKRQDNENIFCPLGSGKYTWRFWGKKANHGLNYDFGYKSFALMYEIPENDGKAIVDAYHKAFPGVRQGFHAIVRQMLNTDRMVINLMGRRRFFAGRLDDQTYKEAYAQIPQSTVADIINERGISYIWDNKGLFRNLSLVNQIHDSIGMQHPVTEADSFLEIAQKMLKIKKSLETPLKFRTQEFILPADLTIGLSLYKEQGKDFKAAKIPNDPIEFAKMIEKEYFILLEKEAERNAKS